jgi:hypothetical protein
VLGGSKLSILSLREAGLLHREKYFAPPWCLESAEGHSRLELQKHGELGNPQKGAAQSTSRADRNLRPSWRRRATKQIYRRNQSLEEWGADTIESCTPRVSITESFKSLLHITLLTVIYGIAVGSIMLFQA